MSQPIDLSFLDRQEILELIFPVAYSPFFAPGDSWPSSSEIPHYFIEVEEGIKVDCGFWASGKDSPTVLYFHGNGETIATHESIAPMYNQKGINLFVADYRGYGASDGKPTVSNMLGDARAIFAEFREVMLGEGFKDSLFVMGRSLGSMPAIEVAYTFQNDIHGLIVESGTANNLSRLWEHLATDQRNSVLSDTSPFLNKVKIREVHKPTIVIHGECDELIPISEGEELYRNSGAKDKSLIIVPGAAHNDIMLVDQNLYFDTIEKFVSDFGISENSKK